MEELQAFFEPVEPGQRIRAVPGAGLKVPLWILGSSLFGAQLAAALGLPFAFASHFAPDMLMQALDIYRNTFRPSVQQAFTNLLRGTPGPMPAPIDDIESYWSPAEKAGAQRMLKYAITGSPDTVESGLRRFLADTEADELMITTQIYDPAVARRSLEINMRVREKLAAVAHQ